MTDTRDRKVYFCSVTMETKHPEHLAMGRTERECLKNLGCFQIVDDIEPKTSRRTHDAAADSLMNKWRTE